VTSVASLRNLVIGGPTVRLRGLEEKDLPRTLAWRNDDRSLRWFKNATPLEFASHSAWFHRYLADDGAGCMFFVEELDGSPVGQSSVYNLDGSRAEVGRFLSSPELRGRGLFREALILTLWAAFELAKLDEVHLEVIAGNERAIRLYESVGFVRQGISDGLVQMSLRRTQFEELESGIKAVVTTTGLV
jgi:RimJ/RimL family protein N-acetyltransferase